MGIVIGGYYNKFHLEGKHRKQPQRLAEGGVAHHAHLRASGVGRQRRAAEVIAVQIRERHALSHRNPLRSGEVVAGGQALGAAEGDFHCAQVGGHAAIGIRSGLFFPGISILCQA